MSSFLLAHLRVVLTLLALSRWAATHYLHPRLYTKQFFELHVVTPRSHCGRTDSWVANFVDYVWLSS